MSVTAVDKNPADLSMTVTSEFHATPERVWQLWANPRQLERWWGPPTCPAKFTAHDLRSGGRVEYQLTGPEVETPGGYWEVDEVEPPYSLAFRDGFSHADGSPNLELPTMSMRVTIEGIGDGRTRMSIRTVFPNIEAMERVLEMGMEGGLTQALGQIDEILLEGEVATS